MQVLKFTIARVLEVHLEFCKLTIQTLWYFLRIPPNYNPNVTLYLSASRDFISD